jgi:polysaccharide biosynthesis/export protein
MNRTINRIFSLLLFLSMIFSYSVCFAEEKMDTQNSSGASHYLIGANDLLNIFVWKESDLTQDVTVMADGRITLPIIGDIMVKGLTVTQLRDIIQEKLKNYISNPDVTVVVKESRSRKVYTIGKIRNPGSYNLAPDMTVLQALSAAGGCTDWAEIKKIMIVRRNENKEVIFHFNYEEYVSGKNPDQNILLEPNDTIVVP